MHYSSSDKDFESIPHEIINDIDFQNYNHQYKQIIIGDTGVGKSCLLKRIVDKKF